jgi:hypothetical protein
MPREQNSKVELRDRCGFRRPCDVEDEIGARMLRAVPDGTEVSTIIMAQLSVLEFLMTTVCCPQCRTDIAAVLAQCVPQMLAGADAYAAEHPDWCPNTPCKNHESAETN